MAEAMEGSQLMRCSRGQMMALMARAAQGLSQIIFPPLCPGCGIILARQAALCGACWGEVQFIERPFCDVTGAPFDHDLGDGIISAEAIAYPPDYDHARSAVVHEGIALGMVHGHKFRDRGDLTPLMAQWMARAGGALLNDCDLIVPVPLHYFRHIARRYNQSAELARQLAGLSGRPHRPDLLVRQIKTKSQRGLSRKERLQNVEQAFRVPEAKIIDCAQKNILLVDDVLTTGATVNAAARQLKRAGALRVDVITFSRALGHGV